RFMGLSGAALFLDVARCQGPLQTDGPRRGLGCDPASDNDDHLYVLLRQAGEGAYRWSAISGVLLHGVVALDIFFRWRNKLRKQLDWQQQPHYEGLLPEIDNPGRLRRSRLARF